MNTKMNTSTKSDKLREAAELRLIQKKRDSEASISESDTAKLIHKLEVHQIELEMQNEELNQAKDIAELSEIKYAELYDFAPSGFLTLTQEGEIINLNNSTEILLGKERAQLLNNSFGFFVSIDTRAVYNHFLEEIFKNKLKETCEIKLKTGDDSVKYILANGIISNIDEKCLVTLVDITKRKHTEFELIKAKEKAEENERLKSSFLANMSHEIRTPMNGILGFTELLKNFKLTSKERQKFIDIIEKSGIHMLNIINDIISISKIESQQIEVSLSETNINDQVEYIYHFFRLEAEQKKLKLTYKNALPKNKAFISTDREKVYAVLTNLVKNAIKFTQAGSIELGYVLTGSTTQNPNKMVSEPGELEFYVKDSGPGIKEGQIEMIFERFRQGSKDLNLNYEGAGLGLSISKAYVEMLGGKIRAENNTGKNGNASGTTFFFTIPNHPVKETNHNTLTTPAPPDKPQKNKIRKLNILLVEDDKFSEILITKIVEDLSGKFLTATTGVEAVNIFQQNPDIDLVLMDINLPEMDGYEATREIRKVNKEVVIIAQTGYALDGDREKSIEAGCNDYIAKPVVRVKLKRMLNNYFPASNLKRSKRMAFSNFRNNNRNHTEIK